MISVLHLIMQPLPIPPFTASSQKEHQMSNLSYKTVSLFMHRSFVQLLMLTAYLLPLIKNNEIKAMFACTFIFDLLSCLESHCFPTGSFRGPRRISCTTLQVVYQVRSRYVYTIKVPYYSNILSHEIIQSVFLRI